MEGIASFSLCLYVLYSIGFFCLEFLIVQGLPLFLFLSHAIAFPAASLYNDEKYLFSNRNRTGGIYGNTAYHF